MNQDRDFDRWNDDRDRNRTYENYGRTGSYSDWDFQNGGNRSRDFGSDYNRSSGGNYGQTYGSGYDFNRGGYGQGSSNFRQGNYDRYGSQDYGRFNRSQDFGRNRDWDNDNRNDRYERNDRNDRNWWDKTKDEVASWFGDDDAERRRRMDERREGNYRGKGPKNYTRSSDRIKEDVNDRLSDAWDIDASDIDVEVNGNEVTLSGNVPSKQQKRRAEDIAESVSGVTNVQNNLRVKQQEFNQQRDWDNDRSSSRSGSSYSGSTSSGSTTGTGTTSGSTTGSSSTGTTTGAGTTSSSPSNQVKIEKSSAS